jgi:hypothetical protein
MMIKVCGGDPTCLAFEEDQHARILALIAEEHADCLSACGHQQGAGEGGQ